MQRKKINIDDFNEKIFSLWSKNGLVLTSGDFQAGKFNSMTVGWGSLGIVWSMPFVQIFVRSTRYTREFLDNYPTFTLCAFPEKYKEKVDFIGSVSGRNVDKIAKSGLIPIPSQLVAAPSYQEATLSFECEKMYWQDLDPTHFLLLRIEREYPLKDYHRIYYGAVKAIFRAR